jgi:drug/metabolite transporter (DMT)-like permease
MTVTRFSYSSIFQEKIMTTLSRWSGISSLVLATVAWGGLFHVGKIAMAQLDPFWFTVVRYICAATLLVILLHWNGAVRWELRLAANFGYQR